MAAKFFGQFLLENGAIDREQLLEALEIQRRSNPMLGELAERRGWLTAAQAARINERQRAEDKRFGDLAEEMGLLDAHQLGELLAEQKAGRKLFGEILVEHGMLTQARLDEQLAAHQSDRVEASRSLEQALADHPSADLAGAAIGTCSRLFPRLLRSQCQFSALAADLPPGAGIAAVEVHGARPILLAVACERDTMTAVACGFLGITPAECDDALAEDALGELVNVLMGYVVKDVLPEDAAYRATPPDFTLDAAAAMGTGALALVMTSQLGPFTVLVRG